MRRQCGSGFRRCLSAALAVWIAVFSVTVHELHTCALTQVMPNERHANLFHAINVSACNSLCACCLLRYAEAAPTTAAGAFAVVAVQHNDGCAACRYLAQPQMPPAIAAPLMVAGYVSGISADAPELPFLSSAAYSADIPRAPPIALA